MFDIGIGSSTENNSYFAAQEAIRNAKRSLKNASSINLGIVFHTLDFSASAVAKAITESLPYTQLVGANGPAIIYEKGIFRHGIVIMLVGFPETVHCSSAVEKNLRTQNSHLSGKELATKLLYGFKSSQRVFGLFFFNLLGEEKRNFIVGLQENLGRGFPSLSITANSSFDSSKTTIYCNSEALVDSCVGTLWGGKVSVGLGIGCGWKPIGKPHQITDASGTVVVAIDDKPAISLYEEYLGLSRNKIIENIRKFSAIYPLRFGYNDSNYLLSSVISADQNGALLCQRNVEKGMTVRLMIATKETLLEATESAIQEIQESIKSRASSLEKSIPSRFGLVFSAFNRYHILKGDFQKEVTLINKYLPSMPFIGLCTETLMVSSFQSTSYGQTQFYNHDFALLVVEG
ncbi:MAG: FIST C-terminal domain-containing protein [Candidatus Omnitrophica bacterium]|nr:FIST C-terminal domain-containing protein [Candidatus Omnitrophota bacterium]